MDLEKWSDLTPSMIKIPITIYKHRTFLQKWWKRLLVYANKGDTNIVITGRPNVGKSVMASYLYGETSNLSWELPDPSRDVESKALTLSDWTKIFRVIPGQSSKERINGIQEAFLRSSNLEGIIYICDWGFTDVRDTVVKNIMKEERGIININELRKFNLKHELEDFKETCGYIETAFAEGKSPKWLLIVVNKSDLFYIPSELNKAQNYYHPKGNSEFGEHIKSLLMKVGEQRLKCTSIPLCSFEKDFIWNDDIVKTNIGGEENRKALLANFYKTISNF